MSTLSIRNTGTAIAPRENPFRVSRYPGVPLILDGVTVATLATKLEEQGFCGTVTGRHGSGKTTLLEQLEAEVSSRGISTELRYLSRRTGRRLKLLMRLARRADPETVIFLDRGEAASLVERFILRLIRMRWRGLVVTTHSRTALPLLYRTRPTADILYRVAVLLAESGGHTPPERSLCNRLFVRRGGNIREALLDLYDLYGVL